MLQLGYQLERAFRYGYGALSVGAPRGLMIYDYVPLCPARARTTNVLIEFTETTPEAASCAYSPGTSQVIDLDVLRDRQRVSSVLPQ